MKAHKKNFTTEDTENTEGNRYQGGEEMTMEYLGTRTIHSLFLRGLRDLRGCLSLSLME